jgi:hypothetical protein
MDPREKLKKLQAAAAKAEIRLLEEMVNPPKTVQVPVLVHMVLELTEPVGQRWGEVLIYEALIKQLTKRLNTVIIPESGIGGGGALKSVTDVKFMKESK